MQENPFTFVKHMTSSKKKWEDFSDVNKDAYSQYLSNRYLSMDMDLIKIVNQIQMNQLDNKQHYEIYCNLLPKFEFRHKYIKPSKKKKPKLDILIGIMVNIFECNRKQAEKYIDNIKDKGLIRQLLEKYGTEEIDIKEILKVL